MIFRERINNWKNDGEMMKKCRETSWKNDGQMTNDMFFNNITYAWKTVGIDWKINEEMVK